MCIPMFRHCVRSVAGVVVMVRVRTSIRIVNVGRIVVRMPGGRTMRVTRDVFMPGTMVAMTMRVVRALEPPGTDHQDGQRERTGGFGY